MSTLSALSSLAQRANEAHREANLAAQSALEYAREAGEHLAQAKAQLEHGQWLPWLEANFEGSRSTAANYMRLASRWSELNVQRSAHLSIDAALKELAQSKPEENTPPVPKTMSEKLREVGAVQRAFLEIRDKRLYREEYDSFEAYVQTEYCKGDEEKAQIVLRTIKDPQAEARIALYARIYEITPDIELGPIGLPRVPEDLTLEQHIELFQLFSSLAALYDPVGTAELLRGRQ